MREQVRRRQERHRSLSIRATGRRYTGVEDQLILSWEGTDLELAIALGRTYGSVVSRKKKLRQRNNDRPDQ